jgi:hypothetical protein
MHGGIQGARKGTGRLPMMFSQLFTMLYNRRMFALLNNGKYLAASSTSSILLLEDQFAYIDASLLILVCIKQSHAE